MTLVIVVGDTAFVVRVVIGQNPVVGLVEGVELSAGEVGRGHHHRVEQ